MRITVQEPSVAMPPLGTWGGIAPPHLDDGPEPQPLLGTRSGVTPLLLIEPPADTLSTTITLPGYEPVTFCEADGEDVGSYADPESRFVMSCKRREDPACPISVDFRRIDGWACIVFHYGDLTSSDNANLPAYTAVIGEETIEVPAHWKFATWRWQSGPWPLPIVPIADLVAGGLLPRFDPAVNHGSADPHGAVTYTPMGRAGIYPIMGATGERPDIGIVTDWQADYICNESPTALANVLAQGEAGGTIPWHTRDHATGAPADPTSDAWKHASFYPGEGSPQLVGGQGGDTCFVRFSGPVGATIMPPADWTDGPISLIDPGSPQQVWWCYGTITIGAGGTADAKAFLSATTGREPSGAMTIDPTAQVSDPGTTVAYIDDTNIHGSGIEIDSAHEPAIGYLPFILTGDPYFLEVLQYQVTFTALATPQGWAAVSPSYGPGMGQTRSVAWVTRDYMNAAAVTPESVPSWLLPKSVMQTMFDMCVAHFDHIMAQAEPLRSLHRAVAGSRGDQASAAFPAGCYYQTWQEDFVQCVVAWGMLQHPELEPFARWHVQGIIDRLNPDGMSGWCGGRPNDYQTLFQSTTSGPQFTTWTQAWTANQAAAGLGSCPPLSDLFLSGGGFDFPNGMQAGLSLSWQVGITEVIPELVLLATTLEAGLIAGRGVKDWKWSLART